jgi:hypothetical protein
MKHIKILGPCLMALLMMNAIVAVTASAEKPAFMKCVAKEGGKYEDSGCSKEGTKKAFEEVELKEGQKVNFKSTSGKGELKAAGLPTVKCSSDTNTGETTGPKHVLATVLFHGCESEVTKIKVKCTSAGQAEKGQIETHPLIGWLFYISKEKAEVGMFFEPKEQTGEKAPFTFAEFECSSAAKIKVKGCVASKAISPINKHTTGPFTMAFPGPTKLTYKEKEKECILKAKLNEATEVNAEEITTDEVTFEEALQIGA